MRKAWEPSYKENRDLTKFDATISTYSDWAQNILDHLARTNRDWVPLLKFVKKSEVPIEYDYLNQNFVKGMNSWEISCKLETFLVGWLSKPLKGRRLGLSNNQDGNGLEMWRTHFREYKGTGELIAASGRKLLNDFPKCKSMDQLSNHLDQ